MNLKGIKVGSSLLQLPTDIFETGDRKGTIIDSGTTLTYLPETAYKAVWDKVLKFYPKRLLFLELRNIEFLCKLENP